MKRQLRRLLEVSAQSNVSIQVLEFTAGAHFGQLGPFVHLEFSGAGDPDVVYVENCLNEAVFRDDSEIATRYREMFWELEDMAASPEALERIVTGITESMTTS